jgi:hypothetical protein
MRGGSRCTRDAGALGRVGASAGERVAWTAGARAQAARASRELDLRAAQEALGGPGRAGGACKAGARQVRGCGALACGSRGSGCSSGCRHRVGGAGGAGAQDRASTGARAAVAARGVERSGSGGVSRSGAWMWGAGELAAAGASARRA